MFDLPNSDDNKRSGFRCPCPDPRTAKLTIHMGNSRNESHVVVVLDESAGGFGVLIDASANLGPTRCAILELDEKEVICEITNVRKDNEGEMRLGLKVIEEVEPAETLGVAKVGHPNDVKGSGSISPWLLAFIILIGSMVGFVWYESNKEYTDKFGRKHKGSVNTAFKKIGSWFGGEGPEKN